MEGVLQFLQTYGLGIALGGGALFLMRRSGMSCCSMPRRRDRGESHDAAAAAGCRERPAIRAGTDSAPATPTVADLRERLTELQAQQKRLTQQIAALTAEPGGVGLRTGVEQVTAPGGTDRRFKA